MWSCLYQNLLTSRKRTTYDWILVLIVIEAAVIGEVLDSTSTTGSAVCSARLDQDRLIFCD